MSALGDLLDANNYFRSLSNKIFVLFGHESGVIFLKKKVYDMKNNPIHPFYFFVMTSITAFPQNHIE